MKKQADKTYNSWWDRHVVSKVVRCGCRRPELMAIRDSVLPLVEGDVFELGCGDGINIALLDAGKVRSYSAVEPAPDLRASALEVAAQQPFPCDIRDACGEALPFADRQFDTVLVTFTLCSVAEPAKVLQELRRILKPDGSILYLEHGLAPDRGVQKWQRRIDPLSTRLLGNCHMSRPVTASFVAAGFETECLGSEYAPSLPRYAGWLEWGRARLR